MSISALRAPPQSACALTRTLNTSKGKPMPARSTHRTAFTLIELLVVIAIIAILAAILFPVFARARAMARKTTCVSNMKQIALGILQYVQDNDEKMPLPAQQGTNQVIGRSWDGRNIWNAWSWRYTVQPYIKNAQIFLCPDYEMENEPIWPWNIGDTWDGVTREFGELGVRRSYAGAHNWAHPSFANGRKIAEVSRPATIIMLLESREWTSDVGHWCLNGNEGWTRIWFDSSKGWFTTHNGVSNWAFYDGHVKSIKPCATFGALTWNTGDVPADDYLWEWWAGPDVNVLRSWKSGCYLIPEYR